MAPVLFLTAYNETETTDTASVAQEKPKETTWIIVMAVTGPVFGSTSKATM